MLLKIWLANIVLAAAVFFVGVKTVGVWTEKRVFKNSSAQKPLAWQEKNVAKRMMSPESAYRVVVSNNLFFVDRSEVQQKKPEKAPPAVQKVGGRLLKILEAAAKATNLYGVVIVGDRKEALIGEVPARKSPRSGERGVKRAKVGDTVGRFKVKEINDTSVLLTAEGQEWCVALFDKDKPKKRAPIKKESGPIVIVGGAKNKSVLTEAKAVKKGPTPKPAVSRKETSPKPQDKKKTFPVPTDRSKTEKR